MFILVVLKMISTGLQPSLGWPINWRNNRWMTYIVDILNVKKWFQLHPFHLIIVNVCGFLKNVSHFINHFYPRHLSVSYSIPAFSLFSFFCLGIINIVFRNFIHLREIYLSLLVCFSICHVTVHCYLRLVNDYSKVRNTD